MVGSLADILLKKPLYKSQMEQLLAQFVFPEFSSAHGHLRARACWVLQHFCNIKFNEETILAEAINLTQRSLLTDSELPVKVLVSIYCFVKHLRMFFLLC
jgi:importin-7